MIINLCLFIRRSYARWARASAARLVNVALALARASIGMRLASVYACSRPRAARGGRVPLLTFVPQGGARGGWTLARVETIDRTPQPRCWPRRPARPPSPPSSAKPPSLQPSASLERRTGTGPMHPRLSGPGVPGRGPETSKRLLLQRLGVGQRVAAGTG